MRVLYALNCEHAEARPDGRLDAHGVFHQLYAPGFPAQQDRIVFALAIEWDTEAPGKRPLHIDLDGPDGSPCATITGDTEVTKRDSSDAPPRTLVVMPMDDVVFPVAGTYVYNLKMGEEKTALAPLHLIEDPSVAPAQPLARARSRSPR